MLIAKRLVTFALICSALGLVTSQAVSNGPDSKKVRRQTLERLLHLDQPGAHDSRYAYVPFDVPPRAVRVSISYQYERADGANTIDIGLFDARSTDSETDSRGFRGWSGGRRSEFFVSRSEATPGYLPGEMTAGTWRVILGLYRVRPAGVDVSIKIEIETEEDGAPGLTPAPRKTEGPSAGTTYAPTTESITQRSSSSLQKVAGKSSRWWRGDLHMHTVHSDGDWTVAELISSARNAGLDFICITDHNTASHHREIDRARNASLRPLVLRGEEITTYGGHANAWGLPAGKWIDFRARPGDAARMSNIAAEAHRSGALISINHPFALCGGCGWSYTASARDFDAIEVWNGSWDPTDELALAMWDKILQTGRHITAIASSDSHRQNTPLGQPATHVAANDLSQTSLLNAIRQGRVYLTGEAARPVISFEVETTTGGRRSRRTVGDELRLKSPERVRFFISAKAAPPGATMTLISNGQVIRRLNPAPDDHPQVIEVECHQDSYFRLEIRDRSGAILALTNPIYVKTGKSREKD